MKILLISIHNTEAYGVRILHSSLTNAEYDTKMLFIKENNIDLILKAIKGYDVLAFSILSSTFMLYKSWYSAIRSNGTYKIIIGGWQPSLDADSCAPYCDALCKGEGKHVIIDMVRDIESNSLNKCYYRPLSDIIDYPQLSFDNNNCYVIDKGELRHEEPKFNDDLYGTIINRGCPNSCTYCCNHVMKNLYPDWGKVRKRTIDHVINELKEVKNKLPNIKRINFYDEIFIPDKEFLKRYKNEIGLPFYCMFYPGTCNENNIRLMKQAGLAGVWIGVQSGSEAVRAMYKRKYTNDRLIEQAKLFNKYGISVKYDFIFNNPFEDDTDANNNLINRLPKPHLLNKFKLRYFPQTDITKLALNQNLITESDIVDQRFIDNITSIYVEDI